MKFSWLWNNVQTRSMIILTDALEVKMRYVEDLPVQVKSISIEFKAWHTFTTNELHEEENDLLI